MKSLEFTQINVEDETVKPVQHLKGSPNNFYELPKKQQLKGG